VRVRRAVDGEPRPALLRDVDVRAVDVRVRRDEVRAERAREALDGQDGVLLGDDVRRLLLRVGRDDDRVVGARVAGAL
jgi:hypothetical protein